MSFEIGCESRKSFLRNAAVAVLVAMAPAATALAAPVLIYDSIPAPLPPHVVSQPYNSLQTREFGGAATFAGSIRAITKVTVVMDAFALASAYPTFPGASGATWNHPLTLNLYNVDNGGANPPQPGTLIATRTSTFAIPWRPVADPTCADPSNWRASDGNCYTGIAFLATFDFTGTTVPNQIIYGLAFNTFQYGASPLATPGPYDLLNIGLAQVPPTIGTNPFPDNAFLNAAFGTPYLDGGAGGTGTFRRDPSTPPPPSWAPYSGAISFEVAAAVAATQVPAISSFTLLLLALAVTLIAAIRLRAGLTREHRA